MERLEQTDRYERCPRVTTDASMRGHRVRLDHGSRRERRDPRQAGMRSIPSEPAHDVRKILQRHAGFAPMGSHRGQLEVGNRQTSATDGLATVQMRIEHFCVAEQIGDLALERFQIGRAELERRLDDMLEVERRDGRFPVPMVPCDPAQQLDLLGGIPCGPHVGILADAEMRHDRRGFPHHQIAIDQGRRLQVGIEARIFGRAQLAGFRIQADELRIHVEMPCQREHASRRLCLDPVNLH